MIQVEQDQQKREQALNPRESFIVQAPAGSGKTELLTQRFLKLLSTVNEPEEILALTFTKKAAAEMRLRIGDALRKAKDMPLPSALHSQKTWQLAKAALQRDQERGWQLLTNPNRLRIKTIDSFNSLLTKQLPLLSHFGASPEIMDYPRTLYREAVQIFLSHLEENVEWSQAIAQLLLHFDNNFTSIEELLIDMLSKRDQWLPHIAAYPINNEKSHLSLRKLLESNLRAVIEETLSHLKKSFPQELAKDLLELLQFACTHLKTTHPDSIIRRCENLTTLPQTQAEDKMLWEALAEFLLTKEENWRKKVDKNLGFPAASKTKAKANEAYAYYKQKMQSLLEALGQEEELHQAFIDLLCLPAEKYSAAQWEILQALQVTLKIVVAQLHVVFKYAGKIDYTENALAALLALGQEEAPTDLALVLDYQLKHILVDEFQDTSTNQYLLLQKLVHDWQIGDGRTLFLVGDPMQSIYRFREADVGLFLRAQKRGLGPLSLKPLTLTLNFRSEASIVDWINTHFNYVLPCYDDMGSGAVSYTPSLAAHHKTTETGGVKLHSFLASDPLAQTQGLIQLLQAILSKNPHENITILVRSRHHLKPLLPALKNAGLAYQAIDIDPLETRPLIQDLLALTRALLYPADAVAWLAILRAPWCGLSLDDLLILRRDSKQETLWQNLEHKNRYSLLSASGQKRLSRILPALKIAMQERHREDLPCWIEKTWFALGGPACLETESDFKDARLFFGLLKKLTQNQTSLSLEWIDLEESLKQLYAQTDYKAASRIQIMTIHNAKGLEFDTVILPYLEKETNKSTKPLLAWLERPLANNGTALLMAPHHAVFEEEDEIYKHIRRQEKNKAQYEQGRLFYVAATRAKKALHLSFSVEVNDKGEFKTPTDNSLLKKIWPTIQNELPAFHSTMATNSTHPPKERLIKRLASDWRHPLPPQMVSERPTHNTVQGFHLMNHDAPLVGSVTHYLLQQITRWGRAWWEDKTEQQHNDYLQLQFLKRNANLSFIPAAIEKVKTAIHNSLQDPRGRWLLQKHQEEEAEFALTTVKAGKMKVLVIDRTFIDEKGLRWLVDYKTTTPEQQDQDAFLCTEKEKYANKMAEYCQALALLDQRPIRLGLYFPLIPAWYEWAPDMLQ